MKSYMAPAALLSLVLATGCADRGDNNAQNADERSPAASEPADGTAGASRDDGRAARTPDERSEGARATAGQPSAASSAARRSAASEPRSAASSPAASESRSPAASSSAAPARRTVDWREVTIPEGTALPLELETALSSETSQVETPVRARLKQAVIVDGVTALPAGAIVSGEVTDAERAGKVKGRSRLVFTFSQIRADNMSAAMRTAPLSYVGEASKGEDATKIGAGAVGGAIIGGIVGGGDGAAKGAAIGGAAGTGVVLATRGKEVTLAAGTDLAATLAAPLTIRVVAR